MPENQDNEEYAVPGRVKMEDLQKQAQTLKTAKDAAKLQPVGKDRMFKAVSMYGVAIDFALIIAVPLIIMVLVGKWLDQKYGVKYFVIIGILLALFITSVAIYKQIKRMKDQIKDL